MNKADRMSSVDKHAITISILPQLQGQHINIWFIIFSHYRTEKPSLIKRYTMCSHLQWMTTFNTP